MLIIAFSLFSCNEHKPIGSDNNECSFNFPDSSYLHPKANEYQTFLDSCVKTGLPGAIMLIRTPEHGTWIGASGKSNLKTGKDMRSCDISRIGSITKTFTATTVMMLAEEGMLNLDDKVNKWLAKSITDEIENCHIATIRQLLNHTSGIYSYTDNNIFWMEVSNNSTKKWNSDEALKYAYGKPAYFKPGLKQKYSNTNYVLLGCIIDEVTGLHHSKVMKTRIFNRLKLTGTFYDMDNPIPKGTAKGYTDFNGDKKIIETTKYSSGHTTPDGGIVSNVYELAVFIEALFKRDLLSNVSLDEMQDWIEIEKPEYNRTKYGLGLRYWDTPFGYGVGHSGGMYGYLAEMFYFPERDVTYILLVNGSLGTINTIVDEIVNKEVLEIIFSE